MEVLGLDIKRKHVCQKHSEGGRNILDRIGAEIARRVERCLAALSRVLHGHFDLSFRSRSSAIAMLDREIDWTIFLRMTLQRSRGKFPLAIELIDDRYCRSSRGVMPERQCQKPYDTSKTTLLFCKEDKPRQSLYRQSMLALAQLVPRRSRIEPREKLSYGAREGQRARAALKTAVVSKIAAARTQ